MNKNQTITLSSINVIKTYDHVLRKRLLHNLQKRKFSTWIVVWTNNFMQNRRINLAVDSKTTMMNNVKIDISQSSCVFFISYLFYNVDLLKLLKRTSRRVDVLSCVNNINIFTYDFSITSNYRDLKKMHVHCETWEHHHEIVFSSIKYEIIHFTRNSKKFDMLTIVRICKVVKQFTSQIRVLSVQIDSKLKWRIYVKIIRKKRSFKHWRCFFSSSLFEKHVLSKHAYDIKEWSN
jgi:hypothetical protein